MADSSIAASASTNASHPHPHCAPLRTDDIVTEYDTSKCDAPAYRCQEWPCEAMFGQAHAHSKRAYLVWRNPNKQAAR